LQSSRPEKCSGNGKCVIRFARRRSSRPENADVTTSRRPSVHPVDKLLPRFILLAMVRVCPRPAFQSLLYRTLQGHSVFDREKCRQNQLSNPDLGATANRRSMEHRVSVTPTVRVRVEESLVTTNSSSPDNYRARAISSFNHVDHFRRKISVRRHFVIGETLVSSRVKIACCLSSFPPWSSV